MNRQRERKRRKSGFDNAGYYKQSLDSFASNLDQNWPRHWPPSLFVLKMKRDYCPSESPGRVTISATRMALGSSPNLVPRTGRFRHWVWAWHDHWCCVEPGGGDRSERGITTGDAVDTPHHARVRRTCHGGRELLGTTSLDTKRVRRYRDRNGWDLRRRT